MAEHDYHPVFGVKMGRSWKFAGQPLWPKQQVPKSVKDPTIGNKAVTEENT